MTRRRAFVLGTLFLASLGAADAVLLAKSDALGRELDAALSEIFVSRTFADSFEFEFGGALQLVGARLMRPDAPDRTYASVERIRVTPDWWSLAGLKPRVAEVEIVNPVLHVTWAKSGAFDMPSPLRGDLEPGAGPRTVELPRVALKGLRFVFEDCPWLAAPQRVVDLPDFNVTLEPEGSERWLYRFAAVLRSGAFGALDATGRFSADRFAMDLRREGFNPGPAFVEALKPELAEVIGDVALEGGMTFSATVAPPAAPGGESAFEARLDLEGVSATWRRGPLVVENLRGRVTYSGSRLATEGLTAELEGGALTARGYVDSAADPVIKITGELAGMEMTSALGDRVARLPGPCPVIGEQIRQWDPRAFCDLVFELVQKRLPDGKLDLLRPKIDVEFRGDASVAFVGGVNEDGLRRGFAYRIRDIRGALRCTDLGMRIDRVVASEGPLVVEANGEIGYEFADDETYDVDVVARGLALDGKVAAALAGEGRDLYESLDADGRADLKIAVRRAKGEPPGPRVSVTAELAGVRLRPREFPLDVDDVQGIVRIDDDVITVTSLTGRHRGAIVRVKGFLGQGARASEYLFDAEAEGIPFEEPVFSALAAAAPRVANALRALGPSGIASGKMKVEQGASRRLRVDGYVAFERTSLAATDPPLRITDASGAVGVEDGRVSIRPGTKAKFAGQPFAVRGDVGPAGELDLTVEGARVQATPQLLAELEPLAPKLRDLGPEPILLGPVEVKARIVGPVGAVKTSIESLVLRGASVGVPGTDLRVKDVDATVSVAEDGALAVEGFRGRLPWPNPEAATRPDAPALPPTLLSCESLHWTPAPPDAPPDVGGELAMGAVSVVDAPAGSRLFDLLPLSPETRAKLARAAPSGSLTASAGTILKSARGWTIARPTLVVRDASFGPRVSAKEIAFKNASATVGADGVVDVRADLHVTGLTAFDVPATRLRAKLRADALGVELRALSADLFGYAPATTQSGERPYGRLDDETSRASYGFVSDLFDVDLRVLDADVAAAVKAFGGAVAEIDGVFGARLALTGTASEPDTYVGSGELQGVVRKVVELPFFLKLFKQLDVVALFQPADPPTRLRASFKIAERRLESRDVVVDARDVVLKGAVKVGFSGKIRADLDASYGIGLMPWTWLSHLVSGAVAPGVVVEGTLAEPQVSLESAKPETPLPPESRPVESAPSDGR